MNQKSMAPPKEKYGNGNNNKKNNPIFLFKVLTNKHNFSSNTFIYKYFIQPIKYALIDVHYRCHKISYSDNDTYDDKDE